MHTLGTLLEDTRYKKALGRGDIPALAGIVASNVLGGGPSSNPLASGEGRPNSYETLNRDAGTFVYHASDYMTDHPSSNTCMRRIHIVKDFLSC